MELDLWSQLDNMAKIKSVKTASGKRVQVGSKAYTKALSSGDAPVSGTGKNLTSKDIKSIGGGFTDKPSTTFAKKEAHAQGDLLPYETAPQLDVAAPEISDPRAKAVDLLKSQGYASPDEQEIAGAMRDFNTPPAAASQVPSQNRFQQGLSAARATGVSAPAQQGTARAMVSSFTPVEPDTNTVDALFETDPVWQSISQEVQDYLSPPKQKETLMKEYERLYAESGLEGLDQEIIDAESIIDGTEDDIRNEVQMAGGFATDSQVQAMALARNKTLLKRYNSLVAARTQTQNRLDTMINLSKEDRRIAEDRTINRLNMMFKLGDFRQQAIGNIKEAFNSMVAKVGYAGAYQAYATNPRQLSFIENVMGLGPGGLQSLASQPDLERTLKLEQIQTEKAQQANIYSQIASREKEAQGPTISPYQVERSTRILGDTKNIREGVTANPNTVGAIGYYTQWIPNTDSFRMAAEIDELKANIFANELTAMREASKTGGAVGNVSDREGARLESALGALRIGMGQEAFLKNLQEVEDSVKSWTETMAGEGYVLTPDGLVQITDE